MQIVTNTEILQAFRVIGQLQPFLQVHDDDLWAAIERKHGSGSGQTGEVRSLKAPEWQVLMNLLSSPGSSISKSRRRRQQETATHSGWTDRIA